MLGKPGQLERYNQWLSELTKLAKHYELTIDQVVALVHGAHFFHDLNWAEHSEFVMYHGSLPGSKSGKYIASAIEADSTRNTDRNIQWYSKNR